MKSLFPIISMLALVAAAQASLIGPDGEPVDLEDSGSVFYSDLATGPLGGYPHGQRMLFDDLTPDRNGIIGPYLDTLEMTVVNFDTIDVGGQPFPGADLESVDVTVEFYAADSATHLPDQQLGTFTSNLDFTAAPIGPSSGARVVLDLSDLMLDTTDWEGAAGFFWIGIAFSNSVGPIQGDMAVGQLIFDPPTIGSSQDLIADSSGIFNFGGVPVANFGYELTTTTPEPASLIALALGMLVLRRR